MTQVQSLRASCKQMQGVISRMEEQNRALMNEIEQEKEKVKRLQMGNAILGSNDFSAEARSEINALIKEIDACIVQLSK